MKCRLCIPRSGVLLMPFALGACREIPICVEGSPDLGESVRITVIEPWDNQSKYPWPPDLPPAEPSPERPDLGPGSSFLVRVVGYVDVQQCRVRRVQPSELDGVAFGRAEGRPGAGSTDMPFLVAGNVATIGESCEGTWRISVDLRGEPSDRYSEPVPGEEPNAVLSRSFLAHDAEVCDLDPEGRAWGDLFVVRLELVP
jgi:hypothetical protein